MNDKQHQEDTKYKQWQNSMHVMLDKLLCDYEMALVEDSLRSSIYPAVDCFVTAYKEDCIGVYGNYAGYWDSNRIYQTKLTRSQALYIATGDTDI
jgi:hypothetical protein